MLKTIKSKQNKYLQYLICPTFSFILLSCTIKEKSQLVSLCVTDTLSNNLILVKGMTVDGKKEGLWNEYNQNGTIFSSRYYKHDTLDGISVVYRGDGIIFATEHFKNGLEDGEWLYYNEYPNNIGLKRYYSKGKKVGIWEEYDDHSGKLRLKVRYGPNEKEEILEDHRIPLPE